MTSKKRKFPERETLYTPEIKIQAILNVYIPKIRAAKSVKQKLIKMKRQIDKSVIIVRDFNTPLLKIDAKIWTEIQQRNKRTQNIINQCGLIYIYRALYQQQQNTHSSQIHMERISR